jgi:peptide/nickel transport system permease protein
LLFPPGILIALTILALGLLGNTVRDIAVLDQVAAKPRRASSSSSSLTSALIDRRDARPQPLIIVSDLEVVLRNRGGSIPLVDGVSFDILHGETVGLVGESGCGKSVTALALLRLLPNALETTRGLVVWAGRDILSMPEGEFNHLRGSKFAYVSQDPQASLDPTFTVGSQLTEAIRHHERVPRAAAKHRALELLRLVEFSEPQRVGRSRAHELSGGMAQRVAIALALSGRPELLIADEPTTALDVTVQAEILALLRRLQSETKMSVLLITHNWGVVADICDRTLVMYAGQVVEESPVQTMFDVPLHPYTRGLLQSHPSLAVARTHLKTIPGNVPSPGSWPNGCRFAPRCPHAVTKCSADEIPLIAAQNDRATRCIRVNELLAEVEPA